MRKLGFGLIAFVGLWPFDPMTALALALVAAEMA